jgi:hypothetical protein
MVRLVNDETHCSIKQPSTKYDNRIKKGGTQVPPFLGCICLLHRILAGLLYSVLLAQTLSFPQGIS